MRHYAEVASAEPQRGGEPLSAISLSRTTRLAQPRPLPCRFARPPPHHRMPARKSRSRTARCDRVHSPRRSASRFSGRCSAGHDIAPPIRSPCTFGSSIRTCAHAPTCQNGHPCRHSPPTDTDAELRPRTLYAEQFPQNRGMGIHCDAAHAEAASGVGDVK